MPQSFKERRASIQQAKKDYEAYKKQVRRDFQNVLNEELQKSLKGTKRQQLHKALTNVFSDYVSIERQEAHEISEGHADVAKELALSLSETAPDIKKELAQEIDRIMKEHSVTKKAGNVKKIFAHHLNKLKGSRNWRGRESTSSLQTRADAAKKRMEEADKQANKSSMERVRRLARSRADKKAAASKQTSAVDPTGPTADVLMPLEIHFI